VKPGAPTNSLSFGLRSRGRRSVAMNRLFVLIAVFVIALASCEPTLKLYEGIARGAQVRALAEMKSELPVGLPRSEAYARIRARGLVASNLAYGRLQRNEFGYFDPVPDTDEWPEPGQSPLPGDSRPPGLGFVDVHHPFVFVQVYAAPYPVCAATPLLKIFFDSGDRISRVLAQPPTEGCLTIP